MSESKSLIIDDFETLKAKTTKLLNDKEHPLPKEVRAVIESWRNRSYHTYYSYEEVCEANRELELRCHEMSNKEPTSISEKFVECVIVVFEKVFMMFRRNK